MQRQQQQQRLRALEHQRKLAAVDGRMAPPHFLENEAWAGFMEHNSAMRRDKHAQVVEWWLRSSSLAVTGQDGGGKGKLDGADDEHAKLLGGLGSVRRAHGCYAITIGHSCSCSLSDVGNVVTIGRSTQILFRISLSAALRYVINMLISLDRFRYLGPLEWANAKARLNFYTSSEASIPLNRPCNKRIFNVV